MRAGEEEERVFLILSLARAHGRGKGVEKAEEREWKRGSRCAHRLAAEIISVMGGERERSIGRERKEGEGKMERREGEEGEALLAPLLTTEAISVVWGFKETEKEEARALRERNREIERERERERERESRRGKWRRRKKYSSSSPLRAHISPCDGKFHRERERKEEREKREKGRETERVGGRTTLFPLFFFCLLIIYFLYI